VRDRRANQSSTKPHRRVCRLVQLLSGCFYQYSQSGLISNHR
jgi:hypothetical protein